MRVAPEAEGPRPFSSRWRCAIEVAKENGVLFLRAYCYLREDLRAFVIEKITQIDVLEA